jgi:hypothetical protein
MWYTNPWFIGFAAAGGLGLIGLALKYELFGIVFEVVVDILSCIDFSD